MRCVLIYSGIHYDAATLAPMPDAPPEWHQTQFPIVRHFFLRLPSSFLRFVRYENRLRCSISIIAACVSRVPGSPYRIKLLIVFTQSSSILPMLRDAGVLTSSFFLPPTDSLRIRRQGSRSRRRKEACDYTATEESVHKYCNLRSQMRGTHASLLLTLQAILSPFSPDSFILLVSYAKIRLG